MKADNKGILRNFRSWILIEKDFKTLLPDFVAGSGENGVNNESDNYEYGDQYVTGKSTSDCAIGISGNGMFARENQLS